MSDVDVDGSTTQPVCVLQIDPAAEIAKPGYQFKAVFNDRGIVIASGAVQHNTVRVNAGVRIFYEHDHQGNALAAMIYAGKIEVRGDADFSPERVRLILAQLAKLPGMAPLREFAVTYKNVSLGKLGE